MYFSLQSWFKGVVNLTADESHVSGVIYDYAPCRSTAALTMSEPLTRLPASCINGSPIQKEKGEKYT